MQNYIREIYIHPETIREDSYLKNIPVISSLESLSFDTPVTFFVGENGSGKSTLLNAIARAYGFNKEGGTRNYNFSTYEEQEELSQAITLVRGIHKPEYAYFFRAETFYNVATMEQMYAREGNRRSNEYHLESHGEAFLHLFTSFTQASGLYLMDEPEAALSPQRQLSLLHAMHEAVRNDSQFIIVTHSPVLLGYPEADIYSFDEVSLKKIRYEETDSYQITKLFLINREQVLRNLFEEEK